MITALHIVEIAGGACFLCCMVIRFIGGLDSE